MYAIKIITIFFIALFISSCGTKLTLKEDPTEIGVQTTHYSALPAESFVEFYSVSPIELYSKQDTINAYNKIISTKDNTNLDEDEISKSDVVNSLGVPNLIINRKNFEIWQYKASNCILSIFWNNNKPPTIKQIRSYNESLKNVDFQLCVISIVSER